MRAVHPGRRINRRAACGDISLGIGEEAAAILGRTELSGEPRAAIPIAQQTEASLAGEPIG